MPSTNVERSMNHRVSSILGSFIPTYSRHILWADELTIHNYDISNLREYITIYLSIDVKELKLEDVHFYCTFKKTPNKNHSFCRILNRFLELVDKVWRKTFWDFCKKKFATASIASQMHMIRFHIQNKKFAKVPTIFWAKQLVKSDPWECSRSNGFSAHVFIHV